VQRNFMATMDLFIVNVSLHSIGVGFGGEVLSNVAWVLSAYAIVFGTLLVPAGRFADRYGRKSSFLIGLSLFTVSSLCCAVSPNLWSLVAFRCVQAAGGAILVPASLGWSSSPFRAILVAILGTAALSGSQSRFLDAPWVAVGACGVGALVAFGLTPQQRSLMPITTRSAQASAPGRAA
jgi:MFS family permease